MENEAVKIFKSLMNEVDKIESTLLNLRRQKLEEKETIPAKIRDSLKSLETVLEVIVKNTDIKTMKVDDAVFKFDTEEVKDKLHKICLLSRRIEREILEHEKES